MKPRAQWRKNRTVIPKSKSLKPVFTRNIFNYDGSLHKIHIFKETWLLAMLNNFKSVYFVRLVSTIHPDYIISVWHRGHNISEYHYSSSFSGPCIIGNIRPLFHRQVVNILKLSIQHQLVKDVRVWLFTSISLHTVVLYLYILLFKSWSFYSNNHSPTNPNELVQIYKNKTLWYV